MASCAPEASAPLRVAEIVLAAAALEPGERESFLRRVTVSEPAVLAEVRRRLELAAELPVRFLAVPAAELLAAAEQAFEGSGEEPSPATGDARYDPGELIGEGGMARVLKAFDRQLQRPVALKLLERGDPEARRRFLREAQAQARVRHDNVLEVYETGELDGRPFIAMRWVDGPTLLAIRGETSVEQKVRLIALVAAGLHAAHREGLIHRDVKPSNVLVERTADGGWKPWIADFGIALWSEAGSAAELAGTPAYLAPELLRDQAAQADRRADVYGLGVTLYELLTGQAPFRSPDLRELLRQVREDAPPSPRQLVPALPADLEAIVLKCLEKDPAARYPSARALADDLWRFLDGEVVEARAANLSYRLARFTLRHRRLLAVAGVAAVLLVGALVVAALLGVEARVANRRAELRRGQAEGLIAFMLTDLRDRLEPLGKLAILDEVGKRALAYFAAVPDSELTDDELARRSQALYQIGDVRIRQGRLRQAVAPLEDSLALAQVLGDREPSNRERLFGLGQSHFWVGYVHWEQGELAAARPHFETYRDLSRRLVRMEPGRAAYRLELAYAESNLGSLERQAGNLAGALASFGHSLTLKQDLVRSSPGNEDWRFELAATRDLIGSTLMEMGRLAEARPHFETALAVRQALVEHNPSRSRLQDFLGTSHDSLAVWWEYQGGVEQALSHQRAAKEIFARLAAHDPENQLWQWKLDLSLMKEGHLLFLQGDVGGSTATLSALEGPVTLRAARDPSDRRWSLLQAWARFYLGTALAEAGRQGEALQRAAAAVDGLESIHGKDPRDRDALRWLAKSLILLGRIEDRRHVTAEAAAAWDRARDLLAPAARTSHDVQLLDPWASVLLLQGGDDTGRVLAFLDGCGYRQPELAALRRRLGGDITAAKGGRYEAQGAVRQNLHVRGEARRPDGGDQQGHPSLPR